MNTTFVTAYYDIPNKFKTSTVYMEWMQNFLGFVGNMNVVVFSTGNALEQIKTWIHSERIHCIDLPFEHFTTFQFQQALEHQKNIDPEKDIHTVELYMIWNEKPFFVQKAIQLNLFDSTHYCWFDIGMIRDSRLCTVMISFPNQQALDYLANLKKMVCIGIELDNLSLFKDRDSKSISRINRQGHLYHTIAGGFLFGEKEQYQSYILKYLELFKQYIDENIFVGKDQNLIANLIVNHPEQYIILDTRNINVWMNPYQNDRWFCMLNVLAGIESFRPTHTPVLMGGLGNQLFQVASVYGIARTKNELLVLNQNITHRNAHSSVNYVENVFKRFLHQPLQYTGKHDERVLYSYNTQLYQSQTQHMLYKGYFQNYQYFKDYLDDIRKLLSFPSVPKTNRFFIHFRFGDYVNNRHHYIDLKNYYLLCLKHIWENWIPTHSKVSEISEKEIFFNIFSNDRRMTEQYIQQHLNMYLKDNYTFIDTDERTAMAHMINCTYGGICPNSTFSWWAGLLNPNPDKLVFFPDKIHPGTSAYRNVNYSGFYPPCFTVLPC